MFDTLTWMDSALNEMDSIGECTNALHTSALKNFGRFASSSRAVGLQLRLGRSSDGS